MPISATGQERYAHFLTLPKPRAFVVYEDGNWRFYCRDPEAMTKALDYCARKASAAGCMRLTIASSGARTSDKRIGASSQLEGGPRRRLLPRGTTTSDAPGAPRQEICPRAPMRPSHGRLARKG